ncbi:terminase family protein [Mannheimia sp. AT1]|uniref:Terminase family protein n=1 Tax=Mannheimia cairinae TaxID=3025936 RepID=A0ABT5MQH7_9PAST|nr:terminase family protein [Mannheimia cairinae]MDD0823746.1 terminase family protein [Mannheimia cairinae]MDD0825322.1 terminase family protein [Mannheimia cairinae]
MTLPDFIPFDPNELLLGYQKRWIADDSQLKIAEKSRRTGLTWAEAADDVLIASRTKAGGGSDVFYIGSNKEMAREFIDACAMWAAKFNRASGEIQEEIFNDEDKDILTYVIYFSSGFKIKALSSNPKNLRGMQGVVVIDEAAFHEYLAEVLKAALALTMWGAKVRLISTHNGADNLFNELILDSRAGKKRYSIHTITLDDACAEGLYQRICQVSKQEWTAEQEAEWKENLLNDTATKEDAEEEYYCVPKNGSGLWLSRALIERQMSEETPVIRFTAKDGFSLVPEPTRYAEIAEWCELEIEPLLATLNPDLLHFMGEDFARSGDMTSLVVLAQQQNLERNVAFIVELGNMPYKQQEQIVMFILKRLPHFAGGAFDARGNGGYLAEAARDEFSTLIECVQLSEKWYREHTAPFKAALEDGELGGIPKDADILADLRSFQVVKGVPRIPDKRTKSADGKNKRHGDTAISLLLAHYASRQLVQMPVEPVSRRPRRSQQLTEGYE